MGRSGWLSSDDDGGAGLVDVVVASVPGGGSGDEEPPEYLGFVRKIPGPAKFCRGGGGGGVFLAATG